MENILHIKEKKLFQIQFIKNIIIYIVTKKIKKSCIITTLTTK